ncbi:hypothetical protein KDI_33930 [Dictyobacter arantiisoli]|uniref:Uncharacterized protein n=1 Tax=Dictyobacter arantiisoli TaxID=2014874 RepID=A0A5A5TFR1_9CHLR|nr:hypothetical protein KDI_33930 [Dictyobacter arantiisoli]
MHFQVPLVRTPYFVIVSHFHARVTKVGHNHITPFARVAFQDDLRRLLSMNFFQGNKVSCPLERC